MGDFQLLFKIDDIDLRAKEAKYHSSCYKIYTKGIKGVSDKGNLEECDSRDTDRYNGFCETIVVSKLIKANEVIRMDTLTIMFVSQ